MDARQELLNSLQEIKGLINQIVGVRNQQINIVAQHRQSEEAINFKGGKAKGKAVMVLLYISMLLFFLLMAITEWLEWSYFIFYAVLGAYCFLYRSKKDRSKLKIFAWVVLGVFTVMNIVSFVKGAISSGYYFFVITMLIALAIVILAGVLIVRKLNAKTDKNNVAIAAHNEELDRQYSDTTQQINQLQMQLRQIGASWYPPSYYCLDAVDFFIDAIRNFRADNIKEAVNLYENSEHQKRMEEGQRRLEIGQQQLLTSQNQIIEGQKAMIAQQRFTNVLGMANLFMQAQTQQEIRNASANMQKTVKYASTNMQNTVNRASNNIVNKLRKR